jgi:hypothetical protein
MSGEGHGWFLAKWGWFLSQNMVNLKCNYFSMSPKLSLILACLKFSKYRNLSLFNHMCPSLAYSCPRAVTDAQGFFYSMWPHVVPFTMAVLQSPLSGEAVATTRSFCLPGAFVGWRLWCALSHLFDHHQQLLAVCNPGTSWVALALLCRSVEKGLSNPGDH